MPHDPLPIDAVLPHLLDSLRSAGAVILQAPPGAGKTTRVPPAILSSGVPGKVLMLEPRRVAARAAARRMATEHGSPLGEIIGYHVRFDRSAGPRTRLLVVTPGILLRMLHDSPFLDGISCVIFDEFHERGLEADLALGMVKLLRESVRPDLLTVVMSATIDPGTVASYLGNCPTITSEGRSYPVKIEYQPFRSDIPLSSAMAAAIRQAWHTTNGDLLAFLPGLREIRQTAEQLVDLEPAVLIIPLHGDLPPEEQDRALRRYTLRKIVLATNVAETSITVEGVTVVVDSGVARQLEFDASVGLDRLVLQPISQASADQRAGRAGRTQPGYCIRIWDEQSHRIRSAQTEPEIRRIDLCGALLHLLAMGEAADGTFPWLDQPRADALEQAHKVLIYLELVNNSSLTRIGEAAARLPVHPRLARMLIEGQRLGQPDRAAMAAALLADRDPFERKQTTGTGYSSTSATISDLLERVEAMEFFEQTRQIESHCGRLNRGAAFGILAARDQLLRLLHQQSDAPTGATNIEVDSPFLRAVLAAFPDRIARRRELGSTRALMLGGRGVRLAPSSGVLEPELFVCVDIDAGGVDSYVRIASGVERSWLSADRISTRVEVHFDDHLERLVARKITRFDDLVIDETPAHIANETEAAQVLAAAAARRLEKVLPPADSDAGRFLIRLRCLRSWLPEVQLPACDQSDLGELLVHLAHGRRSLTELRNGPWMEMIRSQLTYDQYRTIETEAPDRLEVPSGSTIPLEYQEGRPPVLAVRIQELFGLRDTPRIAGGRVKVLLHLLAPNYRPQQVTEDLVSFWNNTYPQIRKELRARYPKHSWPEDPLTAEAIRGAKRKPQ